MDRPRSKRTRSVLRGGRDRGGPGSSSPIPTAGPAPAHAGVSASPRQLQLSTSWTSNEGEPEVFQSGICTETGNSGAEAALGMLHRL